MGNSAENKRIAKNSLLLYADLIISSLVWLYASRILLEALGVTDFGLYNVVGGIVVLLNVINTAMISTSYRYIAYELGKPAGDPRKIFNACRNIHILISIIVIILGWPIGDYYITHYLNVDEGSLSDARVVYVFSIITCAISTVIVPYFGLVTATELFGFKAGINIIKSFLRLGLILSLLLLTDNRLQTYAFYALLIEIVVAVSYLIICQRKEKQIVQWEVVKDKQLYCEMFDFTFWILLGAVARIGKSQGAAILINLFFSTVLNAAYALANQVNGFVSMATNSLSQAAVPQITKSYSGGNSSRSMEVVVYISKYTFIMMLLVCTPFLMQPSYILNLWLTTVPEYTAAFIILILIDAMITCLGAGIPALYQATGKIKVFQVCLGVILISSLPAGYLAYRFGLPPTSLLIIYCLLSIIDRIVALLLLKYKLNIDINPLIKLSYLNSFKLTLFLIPLYFVNQYLTGPVWSPTMLVLSELFMLTVIYSIGLTVRERSIIKNIVGRIFSKTGSKA